VTSTRDSRRAVFRQIAHRPYITWPTYDSTPLYDRSSLGGLEEDVRVVSSAWFDHDEHNSVEHFACSLPLAYVTFDPHDTYAGPTDYEMDPLFRVFVLKELHGWDHETALVEYLDCHPEICEQLELETIPDQSTLWRSWHERFTVGLRETVQTAARTILITAQNAGVPVPREPGRTLPPLENDAEEADVDAQAVLKQAEQIQYLTKFGTDTALQPQTTTVVDAREP